MSEAAFAPRRRLRLYEEIALRISTWISEQGLGPGDRLPPERELAQRLGVSRSTVSHALVALEVVGALEVRHGDGSVVTGRHPGRVADAIQGPNYTASDLFETYTALSARLAELAARRRTEEDLTRIHSAFAVLTADIEAGGDGLVASDGLRRTLSATARSPLLERLVGEVSDLLWSSSLEPHRPPSPQEFLATVRRLIDEVRIGNPVAAAGAAVEVAATEADRRISQTQAEA
jgi:GntR family transcriptional repressor for pyruvate dehydrogenase complex